MTRIITAQEMGSILRKHGIQSDAEDKDDRSEYLQIDDDLGWCLMRRKDGSWRAMQDDDDSGQFPSDFYMCDAKEVMNRARIMREHADRLDRVAAALGDAESERAT